MRSLVLCLLLLVFLVVPALAGVKPDESQLLVPPPMLEPANPDGSRCFFIHNTAPYTVNGTVLTNYYTDELTGIRSRKISNFRLAPQQKERYCTRGPYYAGTRIGFMLRTIVPVFSCYTVAQGTIEIRGERKPEGGTKSWVDCQ